MYFVFGMVELVKFTLQVITIHVTVTTRRWKVLRKVEYFDFEIWVIFCRRVRGERTGPKIVGSRMKEILKLMRFMECVMN